MLSDRVPDRVRDASVLVTGGTGFVGRHLVNQLLAEGADVALMTRTPQDRGLAGLRSVPGDLTDQNSLKAAVKAAHPDMVIHLAGFTDPKRDLGLSGRAMTENLSATMTLAEAATTARAFVHTGTSEEYGHQTAPFAEDLAPSPLSPYSASKLAATMWLKMLHDSFGFPGVTLRVFLAYGPGQAPPKLIPSAIQAALSGKDFPMTSGRQNREFTYVGDLCEALVRAATTPTAQGQVLNIGTGVQMPISQVVAQIFALADATGTPQPGALPDRPNDMMAYAADITRAHAILGWEPVTTLQDGLSRTIAGMRSRGDAPVAFGR